MIRQGDVLVKSIEAMPKGTAKNQKNLTLALGEVTGHSHVLEVDAPVKVLEMDNSIFFTTTEPAQITHQEHGTIDIPEGIYEKVQQKEYAPEAIRNVLD